MRRSGTFTGGNILMYCKMRKNGIKNHRKHKSWVCANFNLLQIFKYVKFLNLSTFSFFFLIRQLLNFGKTYCPNRRKIVPRPKFEF
nr:MAG TPA: hypothetical protein [Caudoviricetes sp.]